MDPLNELVRAIVRETLAELAPHLAAAGDDLLPLDVAGALVGKTARSLRDNGTDRGGSLVIVKVGRSPRVRRSVRLAFARPVAAPSASKIDPREEARASIAAAAARIGGAR
jgi:hypothetical protein